MKAFHSDTCTSCEVKGGECGEAYTPCMHVCVWEDLCVCVQCVCVCVCIVCGCTGVQSRSCTSVGMLSGSILCSWGLSQPACVCVCALCVWGLCVCG